MKNNKVIIYDDNCPLCTVYTAAFVRTGLLDAEGRQNFSTVDAAIFQHIDPTKCNNEIPLIDTGTKQVWYGIDALLEILGDKFPVIKKLGNLPPIKWMLLKLYKFISYNRKVIVAIAAKKDSYDCSPAFNVPYRISFLALFFIFNSLMLWPYYCTLFTNSFIEHKTFAELQTAHCLLAVINVSSAASLKRNQLLEYLGQVNMLALTSILFLLPLYVFTRVTGISNVFVNDIYFLLMTLLVVKEYLRRMKYAHIFYENKKIVLINILGVAAFVFYLAW
jgi:predicted DCC family thiol-disulfide oxidoreductase YuxK